MEREREGMRMTKREEMTTDFINAGVFAAAGLEGLGKLSDQVLRGLLDLQVEAAAHYSAWTGHGSVGSILGRQDPVELSLSLQTLMRAFKMARQSRSAAGRAGYIVEAGLEVIANLDPEQFASSEQDQEWRSALDRSTLELLHAFERAS